MKSHTFTFKNRGGHLLSARLDEPDNVDPAAYVLFAHCFTCGKSLKATGAICQALAQRGMAVLRFDFTGLGESQGHFEDTSFSSNIEDLVDAADWLRENHQPPAVLIGHSFGGAAVLQAGLLMPETKAIATIAAPYDPKHIKHLLAPDIEKIEQCGDATVTITGREFKISKSFLDDLDTHRTDQRIKSLNRALLVMHAPTDTTVDIENAQRIYQTARHPKSFISLDNADHLLSRKTDALFAGEMIAVWATRYLT